jgi:hypothetical protein
MSSVVDTYELSPMQAGMLFHGLSAGDAGAYIEQVVATLPQPLDEAQFLRAWQRLTERHPEISCARSCAPPCPNTWFRQPSFGWVPFRSPPGKLDRKALPAPDAAAYAVRSDEAPLGEIETALARIWCDLLMLERVGRHDHFFELGGNSPLAVQVVSRVRQRLISELPLGDLAAPTVARLAARIEALRAQPGPALALDALTWLASSGRPAGVTGNREHSEL